MKKYFLGSVAAAAFLAGGAASAQTAPPAPAGPHAGHARMTQPQTRADLQQHVGKLFTKLDANHDGFISQDELKSIEAKRDQRAEQRAARFDPAKMFDRMDSNHDGKITMQEAEAAHSQRAEAKGGKPATAHATAIGGMFQRADANKDGAITRAEFDVVAQTMKARMEHAGMRGDAMAGRMFGMAGTNKDGRVSLAEMQQVALARFDRADLNHDGTITTAERQQAHQMFKAQRKPQ